MTDKTTPSCDDCAHVVRVRDGARYCASPQLLKALGHSMRICWERDAEQDRRPEAYAAKCGPAAVNFKKREFV
jgi:hypothetical protein